jgi:hypothetical protein
MEGFKQFFIEVSKQDVKKIEDRVSDALSSDRGSLPFGDIFGNKLRLVAPYEGNIGKSSYMDEISNLLTRNGYKDIDFVKKTAKKEVMTNRGSKYIEVGIGKILSGLKDPDVKDLLNKFSEMDNVVMVISRHPIDVLRMSNHSWTSCHSPGNSKHGYGNTGSYYQCAIQEARSGGAIAYVVKKRDLSGIDLQSDEIFEDKDRGILGIKPLGRVRLRKIDFKGGGNYKELLVPSGSVYGKVPWDAVEALRGWARDLQGDNLDIVKNYLSSTINGERSLELRGGSYSDRNDSAADILSSLYGDFDIVGKIGHNADDENEEDKDVIDDIERRMAQSIRDHNFKNIHVSSNVEDQDGNVYLTYDIYVSFSFDKSSFDSIPSTIDRDLVKDIKKAIDFYSVSDFSIESYNDDININIMFYDEEKNNSFINFEHYMDYAERDLDDKYDVIKDKIKNVFIEHDYIYNPMNDLDLKNLSKDSDFNYSFDYKFGDIHGLPNILFGKNNYPDYGLSKESGYFVVPNGSNLNKSFNDNIRGIVGIRDISGLISNISMDPEDQPEALAVRGVVGLKDIESRPISGHGVLSVKFDVGYNDDKDVDWNAENIKKFDAAVPELINRVNNWWKGIVSDINKLWKSV